MKKFAAFITIIMLLCCITVVTACNADTDALSAPTNIRYEAENNEIVWDEVPFATGGYRFEIEGKVKEVGRNYWYSLSDLTEWFSKTELETGDYIIRVQALSVDKTYFKDSDWSVPYTYSVKKESGVTYKLINDGAEYEIESFGSASGKVVIFDNYIDGKPITRVGERAFAQSVGLTEIVLGNNIRYIEPYAFTNCANLKTVTLPEGLLTVGASAFQNCKTLATINLPSSLVSIGNNVFSNCIVLKSITLPDSLQTIPEYSFASCVGLTDINFGSSLRSIESYAFYSCSSITNLTIPGSVEKIGTRAFYASGLVDVVLEEGVARIDEEAFYLARELKTISIPSSVAKIGQNVFYGTKIWDEPSIYANEKDSEENAYLIYADKWMVGIKERDKFIKDKEQAADKFAFESITLKEGTVGLCDFAFTNCDNFKEIKITAELSHIGSYAFHGTTMFAEANNVVYVGDESTGRWVVGTKEDRSDPDNLKNILNTTLVLEAKVVGIAAYAFEGCDALPSISNINSIRTIGERAFYGCSVLNFTIPASVKSIGDYAFYECYELPAQKIPEGIVRIGDYTFFSDTNISSIDLPSTLRSIGENAFYGVSIDALEIKEGISYIGSYAFAQIRGRYDNATGQQIGGFSLVLPESLKRISPYTFAFSTALRSLTMTNISYVGNDAFYQCNGLGYVTFNEGVVYIDNNAFNSAGLREVVLPESLLHLGDGAFRTEYLGTTSLLKKVVFSGDITRIGRYAFFGCQSLETLILPENITSIGDYAFALCSSLNSLLIGKHVLGIGKNAFFGCTNLTIYAESTVRAEGWSHMFNSRDYITDEDAELYDNWWLGEKADKMCPIIWGCELSKDKTYIVSFVKLGFSIYNLNDVDISIPYRAGYIFEGWSTNSNATTAEFTNETIQLLLAEGGPQIGAKLYAVWTLVSND